MGLFSEGLIIGTNFAFQNGLHLTIKTAKIQRQQPKTASSNSFLRLSFEGLIFGRAYFVLGVGGGGGLLSEFYGNTVLLDT